MNIAITGANGFVGQFLCEHFTKQGHSVTAITRNQASVIATHAVIIENFADTRHLKSVFQEMDVIIHLAGIAHQRGINAKTYYAINTQLSINIARACSNQQLIYFSSIKVNGESTDSVPFSCFDQPDPQDGYAKSKWLAEQSLPPLCDEQNTELLIIRPPLIYGDEPKGNLQLLRQSLKYRLPLPLKDIHNKRDMVNLKNLSNLLDKCLMNTSLAGKTLLVSDGQPLSTTQIVEKLAEQDKAQPIMFRCPTIIQWLLKRTPVTKGIYNRLFNSLELNIDETIALTGWRPTPQPNRSEP